MYHKCPYVWSFTESSSLLIKMPFVKMDNEDRIYNGNLQLMLVIEKI